MNEPMIEAGYSNAETAWYADSDNTEDDYAIDQYDITSSPNDFNISTLVDSYDPGPDYS